MLLGVQSTQTNYNNNFKSLGIKNIKKMPNILIESLLDVKDVFADHPNASVRLKHKYSRGKIRYYYSGGYPGSLTFYAYPCVKSSLIFNLGEKQKGKSLKFTVSEWSSENIEGSLVGVLFRRMALIFSGKVARMKENNINEMLSSINKENLSQQVSNIKNNIDIKLAEEQKRKNLLQRAKS